MSEQTKTGKGLGVASLVLGIFGVITAFIPCFGWRGTVVGATAIVLGALSVNFAKKSDSKKGMGMAGLIMGIVAVIVVAVWMYYLNKVGNAGMEMLESIEGLEGLEEAF